VSMRELPIQIDACIKCNFKNSVLHCYKNQESGKSVVGNTQVSDRIFRLVSVAGPHLK
jgi:hypothetical protein